MLVAVMPLRVRAPPQLDGVAPSPRVYAALVEACAAASDLALAMHAFRALKVPCSLCRHCPRELR
jgi:hypothetical protein